MGRLTPEFGGVQHCFNPLASAPQAPDNVHWYSFRLGKDAQLKITLPAQVRQTVRFYAQLKADRHVIRRILRAPIQLQLRKLELGEPLAPCNQPAALLLRQLAALQL
jgi:hypothetical protein